MAAAGLLGTWLQEPLQRENRRSRRAKDLNAGKKWFSLGLSKHCWSQGIAPPLPSLPPTTFLTMPGRFLICLSESPTPVSIPQLAQRPQVGEQTVLSPLFLLSMEGGGGGGSQRDKPCPGCP